MGFVVVVTDNVSEKGKAFFCETEEEGIKKLKLKYLESVKETVPLDENNTYLSGKLNYAQVSDHLFVKKFRLLPIA